MNYQDINVKCPFYKSTEARSIKCEGILSKTCTNHFAGKEYARAHFLKYCCGDYRNCEMAKISIKKYDSEVT